MKTSLLASASAIRSACMTPRPGGEPVQHAAEGDHADAVAHAQVGLGQPGRGADRERQGALAGGGDWMSAKVSTKISDVRRALGVALGDEGLAAAGGRAPVHPPRVVAGDPRAHLGELEPVAARAPTRRGPTAACVRAGATQRAQALDARQARGRRPRPARPR